MKNLPFKANYSPHYQKSPPPCRIISHPFIYLFLLLWRCHVIYSKKMAMPDLQRYPWNFNMIKNVEDIVVYDKGGFFLWVSPLLLINKKFASLFCRETASENKQFKETQTLISNSNLIRQSFQGYLCKSDIAIFAWRVAKNYACSPFKKLLF